MTRERETYIERQPPYKEPGANRSLRIHRIDEDSDPYHNDAAEDPATFAEDSQVYAQWQEGYFDPQGGLGAHNNVSAPWYISPHVAPPAMNGVSFATHSAVSNFAGHNPPRYLHARSLGPRAPAGYYQSGAHPTALPPAAYGSQANSPEASHMGTYESGAHQSARQYHHENPFLPRPYAPTRRSHDVCPEAFPVPVEGSTYRTSQLQHRPTDAAERPPNSNYSDQISRYSVPVPQPPPSDIYMPPQLTNDALVVRQQQSSTGRSDMTLPERPTAPRKATEQDARRRGIPSWYTIKHWNPNEKPIFLLGTVFDCNSLGKWIFDWTSQKYGRSTPIGDMAGDLWLVLIQFYGKIKRSEEFVHRNNSNTDPGLNDQLGSLNRLLIDGKGLRKRLQRLLKRCEEPMLMTDTTGTGRLGKEAGTRCVDILFGREERLETTEELKQMMLLWIRNWDDEYDSVDGSQRREDRW